LLLDLYRTMARIRAFELAARRLQAENRLWGTLHLSIGQEACAAGVCGQGQCLPGWGDCNKDRSDGCEVNLAIDARNCGACASVCSTPNGRCRCKPPAAR